MYVFFVQFQTIWIKTDSIRASMCVRAWRWMDWGKDEDKDSGSAGTLMMLTPSNSIQPPSIWFLFSVLCLSVEVNNSVKEQAPLKE